MSQLFNDLSIKSRLIIMLISVTLIASIVVGVLGWQNGRRALDTSITNQLNSIRSLQSHQIEQFFTQSFAHTRSLARDRMIINAMNQFQQGYTNGLYKSLTEAQEAAVSAFYDEVFVPEIALNSTSTPLSVLYQPSRAAARYFQYHYIVNNPYPLNEKDGLVESKEDSTIYNRFHRFYHPIFRSLQEEFGYYDIFLIDIKSLSVVYSVFKEVDFATSLQDGPYRESGLGLLANQIRENPERDSVSIIDFRSYAPSYGAPAAFVGAPIFDRNEAVGIVVVQIPADALNTVMTVDEQWSENGLGQTGESYLVGSDRLMRSVSRLFVEDRDAYLDAIEQYDLSSATVNRIKTFDTTLLLQPVASASVQNALDEQSGNHITTNYLGQRVLSSYAPLDIDGLDWAIISEMTVDEAFKPITTLQRNILIWGAILVLGVAFIAILLSRYFVRPIERLSAGVQQLEAGDSLVQIDIPNNDEFGDLAHQFNKMNTSIHEKSRQLNERQTENSELLSNILPAELHERYHSREQIADQHQQVTVMQLELDGFGQVTEKLGVMRAAAGLQEVLDALDDATERFDVQPISFSGTEYCAVCGLNSARLDHARRSIDFSIAALQIVKRFNTEQHCQLSVRIGLDSGTVSSGVVGSRKLRFSLWGDTTDHARKACSYARPNTIMISDDVYERIRDRYSFEQRQCGNEDGFAVYEWIPERTPEITELDELVP
jgi:class 3 adenylate cyclase